MTLTASFLPCVGSIPPVTIITTNNNINMNNDTDDLDLNLNPLLALTSNLTGGGSSYLGNHDDADSRGTIVITLAVLRLCLAALGCVANVIAAVVLTHRKMWSPTSMLLLSLVVYDAIYLLLVLPLTATSISVNVHFTAERYSTLRTTYALVLPLRNMAQMASTYATLTVTVERYLVILLPLKASSMWTYGTTRKAVIGVLLFSVIFNVPRCFDSILMRPVKRGGSGPSSSLSTSSSGDTDVNVSSLSLSPSSSTPSWADRVPQSVYMGLVSQQQRQQQQQQQQRQHIGNVVPGNVSCVGVPSSSNSNSNSRAADLKAADSSALLRRLTLPENLTAGAAVGKDETGGKDDGRVYGSKNGGNPAAKDSDNDNSLADASKKGVPKEGVSRAGVSKEDVSKEGVSKEGVSSEKRGVSSEKMGVSSEEEEDGEEEEEEAEEEEEGVSEGLHFMYTVVYQYLTLIFLYLIPYTLIPVLNLQLVMALRRRKEETRRISVKHEHRIQGRGLNGATSSPTDKEDGLTYIVFGITICYFFCCILPTVYLTSAMVRTNKDDSTSVFLLNAGETTLVINAATDFFFYCLLGRKFRRVFFRTFCPQRYLKKSKQDMTLRTTVSYNTV